MIGTLLLMLVGGIGLVLAVSCPQQVTLRWLRLGGILGVSLLGVGWVISTRDPTPTRPWVHIGFGTCLVPWIVQLLGVQKGWVRTQRVAAGVSYGVTAGWVALTLCGTGDAALLDAHRMIAPTPTTWQGVLSITLMVLFAQGLLGGFLMAMLLGHAYLTAGGEMTQAPFRRVVLLLGGLLVLRAIFSVVFALWPYLTIDDVVTTGRLWNTVMITARWLVGLVVPGVFIYMIHDCVQRRANQSATGILYVASVLVILGEGMALALYSATGLAF